MVFASLYEEKLPIFVVLSGLLATLMLPVGMLLGFGPFYDLVFGIHLVAQGVCLILALNYIRLTISSGPYSSLLYLGFFLIVLFELIFSFLPPTLTDILVHHLAVPKWWLASGYISEISWHEWSYYPMLLNLSFAGFLRWNLEWVTGIYVLSHFIVLCSVVGYLSELIAFNKISSKLAIFLTAFLPLWIKLGSVAMVDIGLALYCTVAVVFVVLGFKARIGTIHSSILSGAAVGLGCATKYNGCLFAVFFSVALAVVAARHLKSISKTLSLVSLSGFTTLIVFSPWAIKNFYWTGNPVYPLMRSVFGGPRFALLDMPKQLSPLVHRHVLYEESWLEVILLPFRLFLQGQDGSPRYFDGVLSPLLLFFFVSLFYERKEISRSFLALVSLAYLFAALVFSSARVRYDAPIIPIITALAAVAITQVFAGERRRVIPLLFAYQIAWGGIYAWNLLDKDAISYLKGDIDRNTYLEQQLGDYKLTEQVNSELPSSSKIYLLQTSNHFYYFDKPILSRGFYSSSEVIACLRRDIDLFKQLSSASVTHIFTNTPKLKELLTQSLTGDQLLKWNDFQSNHLTLISVAGDYSLWQLR